MIKTAYIVAPLFVCYLIHVVAEQDSSGIGSISSKLAQMLNLVAPQKSWLMSDIPEELKDAKHGVKMGISADSCDNGKDRLEIDWDGSPINHTCYTPKYPFPVRDDQEPLITCDKIAPGYLPIHHCMDEKLNYDSDIPTHEGHRPLWPVFGEYEFVPPQRWLHSIEHGAVVMLYHPCADFYEVKKLKNLVRSCTWKHVITPWNMLNEETPIALVAWGCRMEMSSVNPSAVHYFIRSKAFKGPEGSLPKQGQYTVGLKQRSDSPSDPNNDRVTC